MKIDYELMDEIGEELYFMYSNLADEMGVTIEYAMKLTLLEYILAHPGEWSEKAVEAAKRELKNIDC